MNGPHDMGGMHGFGRVEVEEDEPVFHHDWERRMFGAQVAVRMRGINNLDEVRYGLERLDPADYLAASYFEKWILMLENLLVEKGILTAGELEERRARLADDPDEPLPSHRDEAFVERARTIVFGGGGTAHELDAPPRYRPGDRVVTRNVHIHGHTRLPRYARGRRGVVERVCEAFALPELKAAGVERGEHVYAVRFEGDELWGESAEPNSSLCLDLWESYLLPA